MRTNNIEDIMPYGMVCVTGLSAGVGKTSFVETALRDPKFAHFFKKTITCTTRSLRVKETHGVDYYLKSKDEFQNMIIQNSFIEHNQLSIGEEKEGHYYGLTYLELRSISNRNRVPIHVCDINGAMNLKKDYGKLITSVFVYAELPVLQERMRKRGDNEDFIAERLKLAEKEMASKNDFDFLLISGDFNETLLKGKEICLSHLAKVAIL